MRRTKWMIIVCYSTMLLFRTSNALAAGEDLTREEMHAMLKERDAAIIELQHTVNGLLTRLDVVERSINPVPTVESQETSALSKAPAATTEPQGFAKLDVDEDAAQRALERTLIQGGALLLPAWRMQFAPSVAYSIEETDFPAIVPVGDELLLGSASLTRTLVDAKLGIRIGLPFDSQLELGIPYRWANEEFRSQVLDTPIGQSNSRHGRGIGSFEVGLAKTLLRERGGRPDIVGRITWNTGSGETSENSVALNSGFESLRGSLTLIKRTDPLVFLGSVSYRTFQEDRGVEPGDQYSISFGTALAVSPTSSLFASISNRFITKTRTDDAPVDGTDFNSYSLSLGASTLLGKGVLFDLTTGIGISADAPDYSIVLSASMQSDVLRRLVHGQ